MPDNLSSSALGPRALSVIIPAYCECDNIVHTLENVTGALQPLALTHEILVIDDGSTDGTAALVAANQHRFLRSGFSSTSGTWGSAESSGYGFQAEVLVKSLRLTKTFLEVPMDLIERKKGESKAFRLKNVIDVARTVRLLYGLERTSTPERPSAPVPGR